MAIVWTGSTYKDTDTGRTAPVAGMLGYSGDIELSTGRPLKPKRAPRKPKIYPVAGPVSPPTIFRSQGGIREGENDWNKVDYGTRPAGPVIRSDAPEVMRRAQSTGRTQRTAGTVAEALIIGDLVYRGAKAMDAGLFGLPGGQYEWPWEEGPWRVDDLPGGLETRKRWSTGTAEFAIDVLGGHWVMGKDGYWKKYRPSRPIVIGKAATPKNRAKIKRALGRFNNTARQIKTSKTGVVLR